MSKTGIILIGILGLIAIWVACVVLEEEPIEQDLTQRAVQELNNAGLQLEKVSFSGRVATLSGTVSSEEIASKAETIVEKVYGVFMVDNNLTVKKPEVVKKETPPAATPEPPKTPALSQAGQKMQVKLDTLLIGKRIEFDVNRANIKSASFPLLNRLAEAMNENKGIKIEIAGHTDASGNPDKNKILSQERANSVRKYLVGKKVEVNRLTAIGYGDRKPISDNETVAGKRKNRRVEFKVLEDN